MTTMPQLKDLNTDQQQPKQIVPLFMELDADIDYATSEENGEREIEKNGNFYYNNVISFPLRRKKVFETYLTNLSEEVFNMTDTEKYLPRYLESFETRLKSMDEQLQGLNETNANKILPSLIKVETNVSWILKIGIPLVILLGGAVIWFLQQILSTIM